MKRRPRIAFDFDDVFFPFVLHVVAAFNAHTGMDHDWRTIPKYEFGEVYGISLEDAEKLVNELLDSSNPAHLEPIDEAAKVVLNRLGAWADLGLLSARPPELLGEVTQAAIERELPGVFKWVDLVGNRHAGFPFRPKMEIIHERDYVALIDDLARNLLPVVEDGRYGICYGEYGWNHERDVAGGLLPLPYPERLVRAYNMAEVEQVLEKWFR